MYRIWTDFNGRTPDDRCWILRYRGIQLARQIEQLGLVKGDKVILYQDDDDFDVTAELNFEYSEFLGREAWLATPDWSTLIRK